MPPKRQKDCKQQCDDYAVTMTMSFTTALLREVIRAVETEQHLCFHSSKISEHVHISSLFSMYKLIAQSTTR